MSTVLVGGLYHTKFASFSRRHSADDVRRYPHRCEARRLGGRRCASCPAFPFVPSVLKPDFDLRLAQVQCGGQPTPVDARQVPAGGERRLQFEHLSSAEHRPRFLLPVADDVISRRATVGCRPCSDAGVRTVVVVVARIV